jgi:hypothetical protein
VNDGATNICACGRAASWKARIANAPAAKTPHQKITARLCVLTKALFFPEIFSRLTAALMCRQHKRRGSLPSSGNGIKGQLSSFALPRFLRNSIAFTPATRSSKEFGRAQSGETLPHQERHGKENQSQRAASFSGNAGVHFPVAICLTVSVAECSMQCLVPTAESVLTLCRSSIVISIFGSAKASASGFEGHRSVNRTMLDKAGHSSSQTTVEELADVE